MLRCWAPMYSRYLPPLEPQQLRSPPLLCRDWGSWSVPTDMIAATSYGGRKAMDGFVVAHPPLSSGKPVGRVCSCKPCKGEAFCGVAGVCLSSRVLVTTAAAAAMQLQQQDRVLRAGDGDHHSNGVIPASVVKVGIPPLLAWVWCQLHLPRHGCGVLPGPAAAALGHARACFALLLAKTMALGCISAHERRSSSLRGVNALAAAGGVELTARGP